MSTQQDYFVLKGFETDLPRNVVVLVKDFTIRMAQIGKKTRESEGIGYPSAERYKSSLCEGNTCTTALLNRLYAESEIARTHCDEIAYTPCMTYSIQELADIFLVEEYEIVHSISYLIKKRYIKVDGSDSLRVFRFFIFPHIINEDEQKLRVSSPPRSEIKRVEFHLKRAAALALPATLTLEQWISTLEYFEWKCAYCPKGTYEIFEHFIPLFHGGGTTQDNCVPACTKCNARKTNLHPAVFRDKLGDIIDQVQAYLETCR